VADFVLDRDPLGVPVGDGKDVAVVGVVWAAPWRGGALARDEALTAV
jgi:hypothetical protein